MTGSKTDYLELKLLDHVFGGAAFAAPATVYVALYTVSPGEATLGTEANYAGYARVAVTNNLSNFPSGNPKSNGTVFTFPVATGDQTGNIAAVGLWDATQTNMLAYSTLTVAKPVLSGDTPSFAVGALVFTED